MSAASERLASVYGRCARAYDGQVPFFTTMGQSLVDLLDPGPGEHLLDVASGRGACLFPAAERVGPTGSVLGLDLSEGMVENLRADIRERGLDQARVQRMDAQDMSVPTGSYDALTCAYALFVMEGPEQAAAGFVRALRPGGRMAVSVPVSRLSPGDGQAVAALYQAYARRAGLGEGPRGFGLDVGALLESVGADRVRVLEEERTFMFESIESWWAWTWTVGTRALYEALPEAVLRELREEVFALLEPAVTPQGLAATARSRLATAVRP